MAAMTEKIVDGEIDTTDTSARYLALLGMITFLPALWSMNHADHVVNLPMMMIVISAFIPSVAIEQVVYVLSYCLLHDTWHTHRQSRRMHLYHTLLSKLNSSASGLS